MSAIHLLFLAQTNARGIKKGSSKYHVGFSDDGYAVIWSQGTQQPLGCSYRYSFWAFYTKQRGTVPYFVICNDSGLNPDCSITRALDNGLNAHDYFQFWVYQNEATGSQRIVLRTRPPSLSKSPNSDNKPFERDIYLSFWVPKSGNLHGNCF